MPTSICFQCKNFINEAASLAETNGQLNRKLPMNILYASYNYNEARGRLTKTFIL
jgi:hypothetical protein